MIAYTDGTRFDGRLKFGQVWIKGNTVREIVRFDEHVMVYRNKKNVKEGTVTTVPRSTFRNWIHGKVKAQVVKPAEYEGRGVEN